MKANSYLFRHNRRKFLKNFSLAMGTAAFGVPLASYAFGSSRSVPQDKKLGIALVGLGNYSTGQLAPALQETEHCYLAGIVTGTPSKAEEWKRKYNIPEKNIYNYETFDQIAHNPDIDIVYVVLPNAMHSEYTIRAAEAKKHVICEKPMATSVVDCQRMIDACNKNNVKLSIGYRLHFEPHHLRVMELGQQQVFGPVQNVEAAFSFVVDDPNRWRLDKEMAGGGPLMDLGIYCVQGATYTVGETPISVRAKFGEVTRPDFFDEVEESISWQLQYPSGAVADCSTSYNASANRLYGKATKGSWELSPAYSYSGIEGRTSRGPMKLPNVNQQARQMDAFALNIKQNEPSRVPGEMGLRDVKILMAIYEAARTGNSVLI